MICKRLMFWKYRPDGQRIAPRDTVQKLMPYIMKTRTESCIYFNHQVDLTRILKYLQHFNNQHNSKVTVFTLIVAAMVRTAYQYPRLNNFIVGKRLFARNSLQLSYIVKREKTVTGSEVVVKQSFSSDDTLLTVAQKINETVASLRTGASANSDGLIDFLLKFPGFAISGIIGLGKLLNNLCLLPASIIKSDPLFTSAFIANLGSIGIGAPFHHLYEWGTASIFITIGQYKQVSNKVNGGLETKTMDLAFTIDERIADGYYFAQALGFFNGLLENPDQLLQPPEGREGDE